MSKPRCSCDITIPEGAQFCPGCGRPLTEEALQRERELNAKPLPKTDAEAVTPIGFGDSDALRVCYLSAAVATFLTTLGAPLALALIWFIGSGFFSVWAYRRRKGVSPSVREGAKLGWMTGVLTFSLLMVLLAIASMLSGVGPRDRLEQSKEELIAGGVPEEVADTVAEALKSPLVLAAVFAFSLLLYFLLTAGFAALGGVLGAQILGREDPAPS